MRKWGDGRPGATASWSPEEEQPKKKERRVLVSRIERSPVALADSAQTYEALRSLAYRMLKALEPAKTEDAKWDGRLWEDTVSGVEIAGWIVSDSYNDAGSSEEAYWIGQALANHGFLVAKNATLLLNGYPSSVEAMRRDRRFDVSRESAYRFDRLAVCPWRVVVEIHAAKYLMPGSSLKLRSASPFVRGVLGDSVGFETRVAEHELSATGDVTWDEIYEVGLKDLDERLEFQVFDRDASLFGVGGVVPGKRQRWGKLGTLDLGTARGLPRRKDLLPPPTKVPHGGGGGENENEGGLLPQRRKENEAASVAARGCVFRKASFDKDDAPPFVPLTTAKGGALAVRAYVTPRPEEGSVPPPPFPAAAAAAAAQGGRRPGVLLSRRNTTEEVSSTSSSSSFEQQQQPQEQQQEQEQEPSTKALRRASSSVEEAQQQLSMSTSSPKSPNVGNHQHRGDEESDEEVDGARPWVLKARIYKATNVQYDLAETWGLQFKMRGRVVAGEKEASTDWSDKDLPTGTSEWDDDEPLRLETSLNRASETCSVVVCEQAKSDLLDRKIAFATVALKSLPVFERRKGERRAESIEREAVDAAKMATTTAATLTTTTTTSKVKGQQQQLQLMMKKRQNLLPSQAELTVAPPTWYELERSAGGGRAAPLRAKNGRVLASLWLERAWPSAGDSSSLITTNKGASSSRRDRRVVAMKNAPGLALLRKRRRGVRTSWNGFLEHHYEETLKACLGKLKRRVLAALLVAQEDQGPVGPRWLVTRLAGAVALGCLSAAPTRSLFVCALAIRFLLRIVFFVVIELPFLLLLAFFVTTILLSLAPSLAGFLFTTFITKRILALGCDTIQVPHIEARAISVSAYLERGGALFRSGAQPNFANTGSLTFHVVVRGFKFGNPPGFKRDTMLRVDHLAIDFAVPLATLVAMPRLLYDVVKNKTLWSPWPSRNELRRASADKNRDAARRNAIPAVRFERFHFEGVDLNFEMHHGELNFNGIARLIAEAQAFAHYDKALTEEARQRRRDNDTRRRRLDDFADDDDDDEDDDEDVLGKLPRPNQLVVRVLKARGLFTTTSPKRQKQQQQEDPGSDDDNDNDDDDDVEDLTDDTRSLYSGNAHVEVRARGEKASTKTAPCAKGEAAWDQTYKLQVTDPSTVIRIQVKPEDKAVTFAWVMTAKWLVSDPTYCDHNEDDDFHVVVSDDEVEDDEVEDDDDDKAGPGPEGGLSSLPPKAKPKPKKKKKVRTRHGFRGWIRLRDRRGRYLLEGDSYSPELFVELEWKHVHGAYDPSRRGESAAQTAMEQLAANGEESTLRMGDLRAVRNMLADFPLRVDVWQCTIRDMELHIKDLFMGRRGQAEVGDGARDAIWLPFTDIRTTLRLDADKQLDPNLIFGKGVDLEDFLIRFFKKGVTPALLKQNALHATVTQLTSAFAKQLWLGDLNFGWLRGSGLQVPSEGHPSSGGGAGGAGDPQAGDNNASPEKEASGTTIDAATRRILGASMRLRQGVAGGTKTWRNATLPSSSRPSPIKAVAAPETEQGRTEDTYAADDDYDDDDEEPRTPASATWQTDVPPATT